MDWKNFELDDRILKAIYKLGWSKPTNIQAEALPTVLDGKNVIVRAFTGSGKTAIFLIPLLQKFICHALILIPSKDLSNQIYENLKKLSISINNVDIIISTPSVLLHHLKEKATNLQHLEFLIFDEADLLVSFGYEEDLKELIRYLPVSCQTVFTSATINKDVKFLKNLISKDSVIIRLKDASHLPPQNQLLQYIIKCEDDEEKFTLVYVILKLRLINGKTIFFVNNIDRCFRLKLYLEIFGIKCCILNSELPLLSRCHIISQFNEGLYDYVIAADESIKQLNVSSTAQSSNKKLRGNNDASSLKKHVKDKEFKVSRGLDFQRISNVVNFDFPKTVKSYIHRVGRTARANNQGTALSFVKPEDTVILDKVENYLNPKDTTSGALEPLLKTFNVPLKQLEGFKYRSADAYHSITKCLIKEARLKEIKNEILKSEKLKGFFELNPQDFTVLRHDSSLATKNALVKNQTALHLRHIPEYLVPPSLRELIPATSMMVYKTKKSGTGHTNTKKKKPKLNDPLKSFKSS